MTDTYLTIKNISEGTYKEKGSKFIAFAIPVRNIDEIKDILAQYKKDYYDARHVCFAYRLGAEKLDFRYNDDGEPSGTAGKPIYGQILSNDLTDILIIVVRYFGGVKLGTSGLITAYKDSAANAIANNEIIEKTVDVVFSIEFEYPLLNSVMRIIKDEDILILEQTFDNDCFMKLLTRKANAEKSQNRLSKVDTLKLIDDEKKE
jgi:uncharacterized YigZ family protein